LALQPESAWSEYIARTGLRKYTEKTITDPSKFRAELRRTRKRGYGLGESEIVPDVVGAAAPIRQGKSGRFLGALVVPGPAFRIRRNFPVIIRELLVTAGRLSAELQ
jgi:DNA-binding IclR family transcriptional regulator